ncbi:multicopper oxidase family protein [Luedemannella flava]
MGFNGDYLGPTLRAKRGEEVVVNVHNRLTEATTVHWHGMHLPAEADGGPLRMVDAPGTWSPTWRINQPAATLWYHPHPHGSTANQTYQGLAGMFILDDPATDVAALPHEYGVDDVPVIVQDKNFDGDHLKGRGGVFGAIGILGDTVVVNGTAAAFLDVTTDRVRLRLLNASNARVYDFGFADNREYDLVGTDGGLLAAPVTTRRVMLSPGERAEIVVAVRPGSGSCCAVRRRRWARARSATGSPAAMTRSTSSSCGRRPRCGRRSRCRPAWSTCRGSTARPRRAPATSRWPTRRSTVSR